jgi:hypothetical protein
MPFDGTCLPNSPLARLLEADRKLTAERRAAGKLRRNLAPPPEKQARRAAFARESVIVLDRLEELLGGHGKNWIRNAYADGFGSYCLVGGLERIRAIRGFGDHAGIYLRRAIAKLGGGDESIVRFNDSRSGYGEIRAVILLARKLAREVADGRA